MIDPVDLRSFPPVEPLSEVPEKWRQSFLAKFTECPRSAYLYLKFNGGALTHPLAGGTLLHRAIERYIQLLIDNDEKTGTVEFAKDILNEVMRESADLTVSPERFDSLRAMLYHVAEGLVINPDKVICLETPVSVEINGRTVTGTVDFAEVDEHTATFVDWKSAWHSVERSLSEDDEEYIPAADDFLGTFQLVLYAHAATTGAIDGISIGLPHQWFRLLQYHPRQWWDGEGTMAYRQAMIDRDTLLDWRLYLEDVVAKMEAAFETWQFPAIVGTHCDRCPCSAECPIPAANRNYRGEVRSAKDAERAAVLWESLSRRRAELWEAVKGYAKTTGRPVRYGKDLELRWRKTESERIRDRVEVPGSKKKVKGRDALKLAVTNAVTLGVPFDWSDFFTSTVSTRLTRRTLTPHELRAEEEAAAEGETG